MGEHTLKAMHCWRLANIPTRPGAAVRGAVVVKPTNASTVWPDVIHRRAVPIANDDWYGSAKFLQSGRTIHTIVVAISRNVGIAIGTNECNE